MPSQASQVLPATEYIGPRSWPLKGYRVAMPGRMVVEPRTRVLDSYELEATAVEAHAGGLRVTAGRRRYRLRFHTGSAQTTDAVRAGMRYLDALATSGLLDAPMPVATRDGEWLAEVEHNGSRMLASLVLLPSGRVLTPGAGAGPAALERVGVALASLHTFSSTLGSIADYPLPSLAPSLLIPPYLTYVTHPEHRDVLEQVVTLTETLFASIPMTSAERGPLHGSPTLDNFVHKGRHAGLVGFDGCGWGPYVQDLGPVLAQLEGMKNEQDLRDAFLMGYGSVRLLPTKEPYVFAATTALTHAIDVIALSTKQQSGMDRIDIESAAGGRITSIKRLMKAS